MDFFVKESTYTTDFSENIKEELDVLEKPIHGCLSQNFDYTLCRNNTSPTSSHCFKDVKLEEESQCHYDSCRPNFGIFKIEPEEVKIKNFQETQSASVSYSSSTSELTNDSTVVKLEAEELNGSGLINRDQFILSHQTKLENVYDSDSPLYCDLCSFSTRYRGNLTRHIKFTHMSPKLIKCPLCPVQFRYRCDLLRHKPCHIKELFRTYTFHCYFCSYKTNKRSSVSNHIFRIHVFDLPKGDFDKIKTCYKCAYSTSNKMEFLSHFIDNHKYTPHKTVNTRIHPCGLCLYSTNCKNTLIKHIDTVHKKLRLYSCDLCDYSADKPSNLRVHVLAKHQKIKPFKCDHCNYMSAYKKHLRRHILTQHVNKKKRKPYTKRRIVNKIA